MCRICICRSLAALLLEGCLRVFFANWHLFCMALCICLWLWPHSQVLVKFQKFVMYPCCEALHGMTGGEGAVKVSLYEQIRTSSRPTSPRSSIREGSACIGRLPVLTPYVDIGAIRRFTYLHSLDIGFLVFDKDFC